jgi:hypothetical protein
MRFSYRKWISRLSFLAFVVCIFGVLTCSLPGCATENLTQQTTQAHTAYTGVLQAVDLEYKSGTISSSDVRSILPYTKLVDSALSAMDAYATSDNSKWQTAYAQFATALLQIEAAAKLNGK